MWTAGPGFGRSECGGRRGRGLGVRGSLCRRCRRGRAKKGYGKVQRQQLRRLGEVVCGVLIFVQGFLNDGERAAGLGLDGFQPFRLDVFLKERRDLRMELCAEFVERGSFAIGNGRLLVLRMLEGRLRHGDGEELGSIS